MTAQISDRMLIENEEYDIVATNKEIDFDPRDYGLVPIAPHTACWRGYYIIYEIKKKKFYLKDLNVHDGDENYPKINGTKAIEPEKGGFGIYKNVDLPLNYTGKILVGTDFIEKYYIHMGYQMPHSYEKLLLITIKNDEVIDEKDISDLAKKEREKIEENPEEYYDNLKSDLTKFIEESFERDLDEKYNK